MKKTIVYDLTRTFLGPLFATPRGIDRVDFLLARHFAQQARFNMIGLLPTPWGMRLYDADRVRRGLQRLEQLWSETTEPVNDPAYGNLIEELTGSKIARKTHKYKLSTFRKGRRMGSLLSSTGFSFGLPAKARIPTDSIYINVGHFTLSIPLFMTWLNKRRDIKPILMLHDVIPLERPEFVSTFDLRSHVRMVKSVARYAAGLIVSTTHARETILKALAAEGRSEIKTLSVALPLAETFDSPAKPEPQLEKVPYFVVCSGIEPRKNHLLLLDVWRRLCASPEPAPRLVVVGSLGWKGEPILHQMLGCVATRGAIHHVAGLSTPAMKSLIAGSLGLLSPSYAEGFGLPVVEALHLGARVLASDIPAHREVAGDKITLLDPMDTQAWQSAIAALAAVRGPRRLSSSPSDAGKSRRAILGSISEFLERI